MSRLPNIVPGIDYEENGSDILIAGTVDVVFEKELPDTNYSIFLTGNANERFYWSNKQPYGFTIHSSIGSSTAVVDWIIEYDNT